MPKYEQILTGRFDELLNILDRAAKGNPSVSLSEQSDVTISDVRMALRVYQRFSLVSGNRLTLALSLIGRENRMFLCAACTGGRDLPHGKLRVQGEEEFLQSIKRACREYMAENGAAAEDDRRQDVPLREGAQ